MLQIKFTNKMKHDVKRIKKRGKNITKLTVTLDLLANQTPMPKRYNDHQLTGNLKDFRECHIEPDWLLVYKISNNNLILIVSGTGTHSDLFS